MLPRTTNKEYTRIRDLVNPPRKLSRVNQNLFVESFQGLPLGRGVPLVYSVATLEELATAHGGESFVTKRVTHPEAVLLSRKGFMARGEGQLKKWRKR